MATELPMIRGSEVNSFKRCPWQWYHAWVLGLRPRVERQGALWAGTGVHLALAEYYPPGRKRGIHPRETWEKYAQESRAQMITEQVIDDGIEATWEDAYTLIGELLEEYVIFHKGDPHWEVLAPEQRFAVDIPRFIKDHGIKFVADLNSPPVATFVGTYDLPIRDHTDGKVKIVDHKTAKAIRTNHLTMDPQCNGYCAVGTHTLRQLGLIGEREVVKGMLYNFLRKGKVDRRKKDQWGYALNLDGTRSKRQPVPLFLRHFVERNTYERNGQIIRLSQDAERMQAVKAQVELGIPPMKSFSNDCTFCDFFDLCELDNSGGDTEDFIRSVYKQVDMFHDHRDGAINSKTSVEAQAREGN